MHRGFGAARRALVVALAAPAAFAAPSAAAERVVTLDGYDAAGPAKYDKVRVVQQGPRRARNVLVLVPGTSAGAPYFRPLAADLVRRLPGWQVWSVERRENLLEDHSALNRAKRGTLSPRGLFEYYLDWLGKENPPDPHFVPQPTGELGFARSWGMRVAVEDLRRVVRAARRGGREVVLGGHSLGGNVATSYATWDFRGRPGARDLSGLVLIDGASGMGSAERPIPTAAEAQKTLGDLAAQDPFLDLTGLGLVWSAGVFNAVGSTLALKAPTEPSILGEWPLLPANLKSPVRTTNRGGYGYALDTETGPGSLALVQMHLGQLEEEGDPRDWKDGGLVPVLRAARAFSGPVGMDGTAWYHPRRLTIDGGATNGGRPTPAQKTFGLRTTRGEDLGVPIYAFETSLGEGRVLRSARRLAKLAGIRGRRLKLVDRSRTYAHVDPIAAPGKKNDFVKTVVPFLRRIR